MIGWQPFAVFWSCNDALKSPALVKRQSYGFNATGRGIRASRRENPSSRNLPSPKRVDVNDLEFVTLILIRRERSCGERRKVLSNPAERIAQPARITSGLLLKQQVNATGLAAAGI